tara:strand:- start:347 stop:622 length:276 start_codon:yes stop_codon:yes gene_type:complete
MQTIDKLKEICEPHGVTMEVFNGCTDLINRTGSWWGITFFAPKGKGFMSSGLYCVGFGDKSIVAAVKYIKEEIAEGFFDLDPDDEYYEGYK